MTVFLMVGIMILLFVIQAFVPYVVKKTEVFGIYVPVQYGNEPMLAKLKKRYALSVLFGGFLIAAAYAIWFGSQTPSEESAVLWGVVLLFIIILLSMALYYINHLKVKKEKQQKEWTQGKTEKLVVDLQFRKDLEMFSSIVFLLPMLVTAGLIVYTLTVYASLPEQIPVHFGPDGIADRFTGKTVFSSISLLLILLVMQALFLFINSALKMSGSKIRASQKKQSRNRELTSRKYGSWLLLVTTIAVTLLLGSIQLSILYPDLGNSLLTMSLIVGFMILVLAGVAVYIFKTVKSGTGVEEEMEPGVLDADDDKYWKAGIFYINKEDPSMMVEKRFGVGWTVNLGNPKILAYIFLPIVLLAAIAFLI